MSLSKGKISRFLCLTFLFVALAMTAIGADNRQTMVIYNIYASNETIFKELFKGFEEKNNVEIKIVSVMSENFMQVFSAAVSANSQIDVLLQNGQDVRYMAAKGLIMELTGKIPYLSRIRESAMEPYVFGGKMFALPYGAMSTSCLYYNLELFKKYGLKPPKTYSDLVKVTKEFNKHGIAGIGFGGATKYMWPMWFFQTFAQTSGNKSVERTIATLTGKAKFTGDDYVQAMAALQKLGKDKIFSPGFNGMDRAAGEVSFTSGRAAMFYGGTWEVDTFRKAGMGKDKLGITFFPVIEDGVKVVQQTGGSGDAVTIYAKIAPERRELAFKLLDYVTSDEINRKMNAALRRGMSVNKNVISNADDPLIPELEAKFLPVTVMFLDWVWPPEVTKEFQDQIQLVTGVMTTPKAAMAKIQSVFDRLVAEGYGFNKID